jgi:transposase
MNMDQKQKDAVAELRRVAELLKTNSLSQREFSQHSKLSVTTIRYWFGSWNSAIEAAGLVPNDPQFRHGESEDNLYSEEELLQEIMRLTAELGKEPTYSEMAAHGIFSIKPYRARWGNFSNAKRAAYAQYGSPDDNSTSFEPISQPFNKKLPPQVSTTKSHLSPVGRSRGGVLYGEPIDFRGLRHAPVNEQGVVYVFGMVSRELGFLIESVRTAYPDCEGKRCVDEKRQLWEHVLIEFEYKSSNFREHGHAPNECDLIVCWINDWDDCPLPVLELCSEIRFL